MNIRPYQPSDLDRLYTICLLTGDNGKDGTHLYSDLKLLGYMYAAPYAILEPELCFVLANDEDVAVGYILGTKDSASFGKRCETEWFRPIREKFPLLPEDDKSAEAELLRIIHRGQETKNWFPDYPAHLHIDILPEGQGGGWGLKLMATFWDKLRKLNVPGVYLGVSKQNENAVGFYKHIGYEELSEHEWGYTLGMDLRSSS